MLQVFSSAWNIYFIRESAEINASGGKSCFPLRQKEVEAEVMERRGFKHEELCEQMSFEFTLERRKRDAAVQTVIQPLWTALAACWA